MKKAFFSMVLCLLLLCVLAVGAFAATDTDENDTAQTATEIPLNSSVTGVCTYFNEKNWYKFTVTENGYFSVSFCHEMFASNGYFWGVYLYNSAFQPVDGSTQFLGNYTTIRGNQNWYSASYGVAPGTYYLQVGVHGNHGAVNQEYTIDVRFTEADGWEKEYNSAMANADSLPFASPIYGTLSTNGDEDWYTVTVADPAELVFSVAHTSPQTNGNRFCLALYNAYGERMAYTTEGDAKATGTELTYSVAAGTYYIHLNARYGYYTYAPYRFSAAPKHECAGEFEITRLPTCTEAGEQQKNCSTCGKTLETKAVPPLGHQSDGWTVDVPATCTQAGQHHGFCARCQTNATESIPMLPHAFGAWEQVSGSKLIPPIVSEQTCSVCGHIAQEKDWSYVWIPILIVLSALAVLVGVISYFKAFKKS